MPTKAEKFRAEQERSKPKKEKQPARPRRDEPVDTAEPATSASDRKAGADDTADRNRSARAGRKAAAALEQSASGRPSRKSTRAGKNRVKPDSNLARRQSRKTHSPEAQAERAASSKRGG